MAKTKKVNQRRNLRKKQKSRRFGRGREEHISRLLTSKLNEEHLKAHDGKEFNNPDLVEYIFTFTNR